MTDQQFETLLRTVRSWSKEDQDQLLEVARDIEAKRSGSYRATDDELAASDQADQSGIAIAEEVEAAFRAFRRS